MWKTNLSSVGYDTAVIGGTMALDSFVRDFRLDEVTQHTRDGIQANIVSTFQVSQLNPLSNVSSELTNYARLVVSSALSSRFPSPNDSAGRRPFSSQSVCSSWAGLL